MSKLEIPAVELTALHQRFGAVDVLRGIDLVIRPGEVVALLGPNGAGKSSTLDLILGLTDPSAGTVRLFGHRPRRAAQLGLVSAVRQGGGLLLDLTVVETVEYVAAIYGALAKVGAALERAGLTAIARRPVGKCSGGEQQRVRFAMALLAQPRLLVLDEPGTGLDTAARLDFWRHIRLDADAGGTVVFATHHMEEADAYADRIILIQSGRLIADGTAAQIKRLAGGRTVRATIGSAMSSEEIPAADRIERRGRSLLVHTNDSDAVARFLLNQSGVSDVEISARSLQEAFLALISSDATTSGVAASKVHESIGGQR